MTLILRTFALLSALAIASLAASELAAYLAPSPPAILEPGDGADLDERDIDEGTRREAEWWAARAKEATP